MLTALGLSQLATGSDEVVGAIMLIIGFGWSVFKEFKKKKAASPEVGARINSLLLFPLLALTSGCVIQSASEYNPETRAVTRYTGVAWFNNTAVKGLNVGKKTKTTSNLFSLEEGNSEVQNEALKAMAEGMATGAVKGAMPLP